jgi:hypothetical protein
MLMQMDNPNVFVIQIEMFLAKKSFIDKNSNQSVQITMWF